MAKTTHRAHPSWWACLLMIVVSVEFTLHVIAFGYRSWAARAHTSAVTDSEFTILCLGESVSFGIGADVQQSYPRQLEQLLQAQWPQRRIRVVNAGVPGFNSSQILRRLEGHLDEVRPDLILLLAGNNDKSFFQEVDFAGMEAVAVPWPTRLQFRLEQGLSHLRLYHLARLLMSSPWEGSPRASPPVSAAAAPAPLSTERLLTALGELLKAEPGAGRKILKESAQDHPALESVDDLHDRLLPWVQQALQEAPSDIKPLLRLGRLFRRYKRDPMRRQERGAVAQQLHERALALAFTDQDALLAQAELYMDRREFTRARPLLEQLIKEDSENPTFYARLGYIQMQEGAVDEAIASARTALAFNPEMAGAYHLLGEAFRGQKRWERAQHMYQRSVELEPSNAASWLWLGEVSEQLDQVEVARQAWREAFRQTHDRNVLADLERSYPDPDQGREAMRTLLEETKAASKQGPAYWQPYKRLIEGGVRWEAIQRLLRVNLERIVHDTTAQGVRLGLLTYPNLSNDDSTNRLLRAFTDQHPEVLLIDAAQSLSDRFADSTLELISSDGWHPSAKGYGLLARYVMETLVASDTLEALTGDSL